MAPGSGLGALRRGLELGLKSSLSRPPQAGSPCTAALQSNRRSSSSECLGASRDRRFALNHLTDSPLLLSNTTASSFSTDHLQQASRNFYSTQRALSSRPTTSLMLGASLKHGYQFRRGIFRTSSSQNLLAHMEKTANNNPSNSTAQSALYSALLRADMPKIVVDRYETGRFASNAACDSSYQKALDKTSSPRSSALGSTLRQKFSDEDLNAIGEAVAASSRGTSTATSRIGSGTGDKASPLHIVVEEGKRMTFLKWVRFLGGWVLTAWVLFSIGSMGIEMLGLTKRMTARPGGTQAQAEHQKTRFSDVHGCDEAKEELSELVEFLKDPKQFSTLGGRLPKGVLLTGPPGTGKTLLARAVAGEAGVPFFFASGSDFDEMYVGVGAKRIRELFASARAKAPSIIFIDELDAVGGKRAERDPAYAKQSLNQLLTELDGFSQETGVVILAATNLPRLLDKALIRPGRFDRMVPVPLPDVRGRLAILKHHMKKVQFATDVDESIIARGTVGFSGADLENLINQAAVRASKHKATKIAMKDLEWSKDKIIMGAERRSMVVQDKDKLMTAYHEAGHALVSLYTPGCVPLYKVTIMPRGQSLGHTAYMDHMDRVSLSKKEIEAKMSTCMGGKVAEEIVYGEDNATTGCSSDIQQATSYARMMIAEAGMSSLGNMDFASGWDKLSPGLKSKVEHEMKKAIDLSRQRAFDILTEHRQDLEALAKALVEYETLDLAEVQKVLKGEKLSKIASSPSAGIKLPEMKLSPDIGSAGIGGASSGPSEAPVPAAPPASHGAGTESQQGGSGGAEV